MNVPLCEEDCDYEGLNIETFQVICYCPIKIDVNKEPILNQFKDGLSDLKNRTNFKVLSCYKFFFYHKGQIKNYLSEIFIFFF